MKLKLFCCFVLFLAITLFAPIAQAAAPSAQMGHASFTTAPRQVVLDALPQVTAPTSRKPQIMPDRGDDAVDIHATHPGMVVAPARTYTPMEGPKLLQSTTPGISQSYIAEDEAACGFFIPSDHALAASQFYVVQVINECIDIHLSSNSAHEVGYPKSLQTFFGVAGHSIGDPRVLFDWKSRRFIVVAEDFTANAIDVAVSTSLNPTSSWFIYSFSGALADGGCADFPMVGQTLNEQGDSKGGIYISWDSFNCSTGGFSDDVVLILPKTPMYAGGGFSAHFFFNFNAGVLLDHIQPANTISAGDMPSAEFMVNDFDFNSGCFLGSPCNGLVVWAIKDGVPPVNGSPSISGLVMGTANNYIQPVSATQPGAPSGTTCAINTGPVGITGGVTWSAGDLYAATTTGALNGAAGDGFITWQIHPTLNNAQALTAASMRNEICQGCGGAFGNNGSEYYPTPVLDDEGNVTVVFNYSDASTFPSSAFISKRTTQAQNTFNDSGLFFVVGAAGYCQLDNSGRNRWGDYTAGSSFGITSQHPAFWFAAQHSEASGNWGTAVGKNGYFNPDTP